MQTRMPTTGDIIAERYELLEIIGKGAFGAVYKARQMGIDRHVAIKVLLSDVNKVDSTAVARFQREARLSSSLEHPNTVTVHDYGQSNGVLYLAMEYIRGISLQRLLREEGRLSIQRSVRIIRQVLLSLQEAHSRGIVHRDMKPGNVMLFDRVGEHDVVKVLDFGIAKFVSHESGTADVEDVSKDLTVSGRIVGTPRYMAPEQIRGNVSSPSSDLYSLGLILYEMTVGHQAVQGDNTLSLIAMQLGPDPAIDPDDTQIPAALRPIITKATAKNPKDRYQSALAFLRALEQLEAQSGLAAATPPPPPSLHLPDLDPEEFEEEFEVDLEDLQEISPPPEKRKAPLAAILGAVLVVALLAGVAFATMGGDPKSDKTPEPAATATKTNPKTKKKAPSRPDTATKVAPKTAAPKTEAKPKPSTPTPPVERTIEVTSFPQGADVLRDGKKVGETPLTLAIPVSKTTQVTLSQTGFLAANLNLDDKSPPTVHTQLKSKEAPKPSTKTPPRTSTKTPPRTSTKTPPKTTAKKPPVKTTPKKDTKYQGF